MTSPVALVAGASRGLGLLIARELLERDHTVVICARDRHEVDDAARLLDPTGDRVYPYACDVADRGAVEALVRWTEAEVGANAVAVASARSPRSAGR